MADVLIPAAEPPLDEHGEPRPCPRCGRIFERPTAGSIDGQPIRLAGHVPGDAVCRTVPPATKGGVILDARMRRAARSQL